MHEGLRRLGIGAGLALLLCGCSSQQREISYRERGAKYLTAKNYEKARIELNNALQINPKDPQARLLAGQVAERLSNPRDALGDYQAAIDADPSLAVARAGLARLYLFGGMADKSASLVEEGLKLAPGEPHLLTVRGAARAQQGDLAAAVADAETAAKVIPNDEFVLALLASVYRQQGRSDAAIATMEEGLRHLPGNVDLRYVLADLLQAAHRPTDAAAQLQQIIQIEPTVITHRYRLAQYQFQQKDAAGAEKTLRDAIIALPTETSAKVSLVQLLAESKGAPAAEAQLKQFLAAESGNDVLRLSFADYYEKAKNPTEAGRLYQAVIDHAGTKPDGLTARVRLARLRLADKDTAQTVKLVDEVLKASPSQADALVLHGELAIERGDAPTAITDLRAVLRDQPNNLQVMRALARAHQLNKEPSLAEEVLRSARQINPKDTDTGIALLLTLEAANKIDEAVSLAQQMAQEQPGNPAVSEQLFRVQLMQKDFGAARETALGIERSQPKLSLGFYLAGLADEALQHTPAAVADYDQALQAQPEVIEPLAAVVRLDLAAKQSDRALVRLDRVIAAYPNHVVARNLKAEVLLSQKHFDQAAALYGDLITQSPAWPIPYRGLALSQVALKQGDAAVVTLDRGISATHDVSLYTDLGSLYESQARPEDAIKIYERLLQENPKSLLAMNNLATLLASYRNDKASLDRAAQLATALGDVTDPKVLDTRGWVAFRTGAYGQAVPLLQQALEKYPDSPLLHYRLGMAQFKNGDTLNARQNLELALKSGQTFLGVDDARATLASIKVAG